MFTNDVIWLNDTVDPTLCKQITGTFHTSDAWGDCTLELHLSEEGLLTGHFITREQTLEVKGGIGQGGMVYGFLLEPVASVPFALLRINASEDVLGLELDVPEFTELLDDRTTEQVSFKRVVVASCLEKLLVIED
jgi:hypothetical protein